MDKFVLYKVFSKTCGPCKLLENNLVDANIKHTSIDIDSTEGESFVDKYGIRSVPTLLIIDSESNEVVKKHVGLLNIEGLKDFVLSYIS